MTGLNTTVDGNQFIFCRTPPSLTTDRREGVECTDCSHDIFMKPGTHKFKIRRDRLHVSENYFGRTEPPTVHEEYDHECDASYVQLSSMPVAQTREYRGMVLVDTDERGRIRGIEFLGDGPIDTANDKMRDRHLKQTPPEKETSK